MINNVKHCFSVIMLGTHNRLVAGSSPAGATKLNKDLDKKLSRSFLFGHYLGDAMGDVTLS